MINSLELGKKVIKDKIPLIPKNPGVYKMLSSTGEIIFTENVGASLAVIELNNGDIVVAGANAFLDGGYGGEAIIKRVSFSN